MPTYLDYLHPRLDADARLNDFIELRDGRVIFGGALDLLDLAGRYGAPLEVCGKLGSLAAAEVISHIGARPEIPLGRLAREHGLID